MPPYSFSITKLDYSSAAVADLSPTTRLSLSMAIFSKMFTSRNRSGAAPHLRLLAHPHSVCPSPLSFALLTASHMLSFPAGTKIFQFPAYACTTIHGAIGYPGFNVRLATTPGLSQLATAFNAIRAKPSSRWLKNFLSSLLLLKSIAYWQSHTVSWRISSSKILCISSSKN